jgi:hypothetical protein
MKTKLLSAAFLAIGLSACDGPWNMSVDDQTSSQSLWVSSIQVAGRPYDTIWIEGVNPFSTAHDPSAQVVDTGSRVWIIDSSSAGRDSIPYRMLPGTPAAWVPEATRASDAVRSGADLLFRAEVRRDGAAQSLSARSYTPSVYALGKTIGVPMEALHPHLADGIWRDSIKAAAASKDGASLARFAKAVNDSNGWANVTPEELASYAAGNAVMFDYPASATKPTHRLWYVTDEAAVRPHPSSAVGENIKAYSRQWIIRQPVRDPRRYGGTVMLQRFDPTRAFIDNPLNRQLEKSLGGMIDSANYFQRGNSYLLQVAPAYGGSTPGWPDSILISGSLVFVHTGVNRLLSYSVDSLYYEFYRSLGGSGDGQAYRYTNVRGGNGFFTGAALDSSAVDVESSVADTFAMENLRKAWCDSTYEKRKKGNSTAIPLAQLRQYCPEYTWSK